MSLDIMVPLQKRLNLLLLYTFIGLDSPFLSKFFGFLTTSQISEEKHRQVITLVGLAWFPGTVPWRFWTFFVRFFRMNRDEKSHHYGIRIEHLCEKQSSYDQM